MNKTAIITGAGQGIGRGIALALAQEGYNIIASDINKLNAQKVAAEATKFGVETLAVKCNVAKKSEIKKLISAAKKRFNIINALINNAGIFPFVGMNKMTEKDWDKVIDINLKGTFICSQEAAKIMPKGSRIINISSIAAFIGFEGLTHYCASKGGVNAMTRAMALELAPKKITVNAIAPGAIDTPGASQPDQPRTAAKKQRQQTIAMIPLSRMGQPEDIAGAVSFLASDKASYITGQIIVVDGGWTLR